MVMGFSANPTTKKFPLCPFASPSFTSSKPLKRREVCIIRNTFSNSRMLSAFPRFYCSFDYAGKPPNKWHYELEVYASSAKMIRCHRYEGKSSLKEISNLPKVDEEKGKWGSRTSDGAQFQKIVPNNPHTPNSLSPTTLPAENIFSTPERWPEETGKLRKMKAKASAQIMTAYLQDGEEASESKQAAISTVVKMLESKYDTPVTLSETSCLQDDSSDSYISDDTSSELIYLQEVKQLDENNIREQLLHSNGGKYSLNPKSHSTSKPSVGGQNMEDNGKKAMDHVNGQKLVDNKSNGLLPDLHWKLASIYSNVMVIDNVSAAKKVVRMLTHEYRHLVHACDTEVAKIDVKQETPVDHGEVICFSIYSGPEADFGNGMSCIWIDLLDGGGRGLLDEFAPFLEDPSIKKVWHNYSFDNHVIENYGLKVCGFHADTMHMARLWDSSRQTEGGYSLEALTGDQKVMSEAKLCGQEDLLGKTSMKTIFGRKKVKKDGSEGKISTIPPVEMLQREERNLWICYSALDAISTLKLYESLKKKLSDMSWKLDGRPIPKKSMFDFYQEYLRPFGEILVKMETEGMLVDRAYLAEIEKVAKAEQEDVANRFRNWASKYCPDAKHMNVGSDTQLRQFLFGGTPNSKDMSESLPHERIFKVPNTEGVIEEGKKTPAKYHNIKLCSIGINLPIETYTATGWPSVSGDALKTLARNISEQYDFVYGAHDLYLEDDSRTEDPEALETSERRPYIRTFESEQEARKACRAIAALCDVCSIDSLISNFILPLQGSNVSGKDERVHCSLNINTETGRLSARRPNLQNQPALEKDRYKIRQAFIAAPGNSLIVADYGQLELRILAHLANCKSMLDAFKAGGDFHSRTAMNMYPHIRNAVETEQVLLEWHPQPGEDKPPVPLLKDAFGSERRKAKMLNFSIAYGKTPVGLARDWKVSVGEAKETVNLWYKERQEVLKWQEALKKEAHKDKCVYTLLGRARRFPSIDSATRSQRNHFERAAINTPVQGSAADVAMCAMLEISKNARLKKLGWRLLLQVHDEVILEGPRESAKVAKAIVVDCMSKPFNGKNILRVDLSVDAKCAQNWYSAK